MLINVKKLIIHSKPDRNQSKLTVCSGSDMLAYIAFSLPIYQVNEMNRWSDFKVVTF